MCRRPFSLRVSSALLWLWFAAFAAVPTGWRLCPMHVPAAAVASDDAVDVHRGHVHGTAAPSSHSERHQGGQAPRHSCDCTTNCCGAPTVVILEAPVGIASAAILRTDATLAAAPRLPAVVGERLLPFANGPPAA